MSNKIMACCWFFIIGIVIGTLYAISIDYVPKLYIISLVLFLLGLILLILKKKLNLAIPAFIGLLFLLIAFLIFGYTRYIHLTKITDKNHISNFTEKGWGKIKVEIEGYVSEDPDIFEDKTRLIVTPITYRRLDDEENLGIVKISGGDIFVQIKKDNFGRENESWYEVSTSKIYGAKVTLRGKLLDPPIASNPGTLDWAQNLKAFGYFAVMWSPEIDVERDASGKLVKVSVNGAFLDWLTNFALNVKEKMLKVIRQTMPYPESAFLGGVTLGLKRGLSGKPCIKNSYYKALLESVYKEDEEILNEWYKKYDKRKEVCDEMIENEFRWAGVSHVLAVSGLHVTIITAMLVGIFSAFKMKKKIYAPLVVFCLIVFCIITGAPPSSTRAVIMNSIALITFVYGGKGLKTSLLFGIAGAAFLILLYNPSAIYQPSFTLSFGAVLSLGLLTGPIEYYLRKLKGLPFWFTIFYLLVITFVANNFWFAFKSTQGLIISIGLYFVLLFLLIKVDSMYPIFGSYGFNNLPLWIRGFISAQFAIQLGMMTPLSSFYFGRMPIAGPYANVIAIPLIGVIVQLGMIAGLIGMIPYFGIYIALLLNATNYLLCKFFLLVAHYSKEWFIYPAVPKLTVGQLLLYYAVILVFVWHMRIIYQLKKLFFAYNIFTETSSQKKITFSLIGLALVLFIIGLIIVTPSYHNKFKITNLSTGFSSASFIEFPDETFWLIDGAINIEGEYRHPFARRNEGEQTVLQFLISKRITKLDGVILTSLEKEHISGLISVLQYIEVKKIYDQVAPEAVNPNMNIKDFFEAIGDFYLKDNSDKWWVKEYYTNYMDYLKIIKKQGIKHLKAKADETILNKDYKGKKMMITFLNPQEKNFYKLNDNSVVVKFSYGNHSIIFTSDISYNVIDYFNKFDNKSQFVCDILVYPNHGYLELDKKSEITLEESISNLINLFQPKYVVVQYGSPAKVLGMRRSRAFKKKMEESKNIIESLGVKYFNTNDDLAIISESDGEKLDIQTYKEIKYGKEKVSVSEEGTESTEVKPDQTDVESAK